MRASSAHAVRILRPVSISAVAAWNSEMRAAVDGGHLRDAPHQVSTSAVAAWNSEIRAAVDGGHHRDALHLYIRMLRGGVLPDNLTFPFVAKACGRLGDDRTARVAHAHMVKSPFGFNIFVLTAVLDMYWRCGQTGSAYDVFVNMPERDVTTWNAMLAGYVQLGSLGKALVHFGKMRTEGHEPDLVTLVLLTQACATEKSLRVAMLVHCLSVRMGADADIILANTLISAYSKSGDLNSAELVFSGISLHNRTTVSWNSLIAGYAYLGRLLEAVARFQEMRQHGIRPDLSTSVTLLSLFAQSAAFPEGKILHSLVVKEGFDSNSSVGNCLISLYAKCGQIDVARFCFDNMPTRTCISWTALIDGYALKGDINGTVDLFYAMLDAGEKPDFATIIAILSACGRTGALEIGRLMNEYAIANRLDEETMLCNALLDMYMKCGSCVEAQRLFNKMSDRTVVSWTTMISGYAMNGDFNVALGLFSQMMEFGLEPNHITFLAVLQACTHAGFLEKGLRYLGMMTKVYKIAPLLEHYACIVDLLGRKGETKKALEFIQDMPMKPDDVVWGALLGACITHHEVEVGEHATLNLLEIKSQTAVSYVSMANVYAGKGRWEGVAKIRGLMREQGARKTPGQSAVNVNGRFHIFAAQEINHPEILRVYETLHGLSLLLKMTDSEMDLAFVLPVN